MEEVKEKKEKTEVRCTGHKIYGPSLSEMGGLLIAEDNYFMGCGSLFSISEDDLYQKRHLGNRQIAAFICPKCGVETNVYVYAHLKLRTKPVENGHESIKPPELAPRGIIRRALRSFINLFPVLELILNRTK